MGVVPRARRRALLTVSPLPAQKAPQEFWPQWRGPQMSGVSQSANPPTEWSESKNVRWKVEIPGRGSASPVVWGDRVYVLTAMPAGASVGDPHAPRGGLPSRGMHRFVVMAINRKDGKVVWQQTAREAEPHEALAQRQRHLGVELGAHRRRARDRTRSSRRGSTPTT